MKEKKERIIIFILVMLIFLVSIGIVVIKITTKSKDTMNIPNTTEENKISYSCKVSEQDIDFAKVETKYVFDYINNTINNARHIYTFQFINNNYYQSINQEDLFTELTPMKEEKDENNLTKIYYVDAQIPYEEKDLEINTYLDMLSERGYTCEAI